MKAPMGAKGVQFSPADNKHFDEDARSLSTQGRPVMLAWMLVFGDDVVNSISPRIDKTVECSWMRVFPFSTLAKLEMDLDHDDQQVAGFCRSVVEIYRSGTGPFVSEESLTIEVEGGSCHLSVCCHYNEGKSLVSSLTTLWRYSGDQTKDLVSVNRRRLLIAGDDRAAITWASKKWGPGLHTLIKSISDEAISFLQKAGISTR